VDLTNGQLTPNNNTPLLTQALSGTSLKFFFSSRSIVRFLGLLYRAAIDSRGNANDFGDDSFFVDRSDEIASNEGRANRRC
jgi:hypothetical protein